jgi:enoyl-CoA hydratase/carnithine racemase
MTTSENPRAGGIAPARTVTFELDGRVAHIGLNRPDKLNAINTVMLDELRSRVDEAARQPEVKAIVLHGNGRAFSAGGDLAEVAGLVQDNKAFDEFLTHWHEALTAIESVPLPVIGAIHGLAFAGGFELMQVCDIVVAGDETRIGDQHATFGLFPAGGSTQRLPRQVGSRLATWMLMSGESIDAHTALSAGLVNEVVAERLVLTRAQELASVLAARSRGATAAIKAAIATGRTEQVARGTAQERHLAVAHMASADVQRGLAAFRARTTPDFP